ncbi:MAG: alpha/beta hydrolase [Gammaproteobacteria bacterium]|nr:alpha/beta hydrolase [Gammaproteobacteria bacterium]
MSEAVSYQERELGLATGNVHVLEEGSGKPIVILHHSWGNPGWLPYYDELANAHRVIVPDMPGWGGSERPAWAREPRDIAILIGHVLDGLEVEDATLVGFGFGGFVAAELATMDASRLSKLVLVGAAGLQPEDGEILDQMLVSHRAYIEQSFRDRDTYVAHLGEDPPADVRDLWDFSREMTARVTWKPYMFNRRLGPLLSNLALPTLLVWGENDKIVPAQCADQYAKLLPNARVEIIKGAGHLVELEEPEQITSLIIAHATAE